MLDFMRYFGGGSPKGIKRRETGDGSNQRRANPEGDQATGEALVIYINRIRMFVCLSVCLYVNYILGDEGRWGKSVNGDSWAIYQGRSSLCFFNRSSIIPDTRLSGGEKGGQNGLFLEVFGKFDPLPERVFNPNFKRRQKVMRYTLLGSFRKFGLI